MKEPVCVHFYENASSKNTKSEFATIQNIMTMNCCVCSENYSANNKDWIKNTNTNCASAGLVTHAEIEEIHIFCKKFLLGTCYFFHPSDINSKNILLIKIYNILILFFSLSLVSLRFFQNKRWLLHSHVVLKDALFPISKKKVIKIY